MNSGDMTAVIITAMVLGIPLLGFTARMVMKPMVEALVRLREAGVMTSSQQQLVADQRMNEIQAEVESLRHTVERLVEAESFNRQLGAGQKLAAKENPQLTK